MIDLTFQTFGKLWVLNPVGKNKQGNMRWLCLCACGRKTICRGVDLSSRNTQSCGRSCGLRDNAQSHGLTRKGAHHPLYDTWAKMRHRCNSSTDKTYAYYGGRGIKVCERWEGSDGFPNFLADMGERPGGPRGSDDYHSLDRINNEGDYEPGNCKWSTPKEQRANRRDSVAA